MENTTQDKSRSEFANDLVNAIASLQNVAKSADNPYFKSKYAPLDAIIEATRPVLAKHNLAVQQLPIFEDGKAGVVTRIVHRNGTTESSTLLLPLKDQSPQGVGSAITYARRYSIASVLGIASEDDDDGNVSSGLHKKEEARPAVAKIIDRKGEVPRPAGNVSTVWRGLDLKDAKIAMKSKEGSPKKWTLYAVTFDGGQEAMTFDEKLYKKAQELAWEKVDAGVAPSKRDPSKWELVTLDKSNGVSEPNITPDTK